MIELNHDLKNRFKSNYKIDRQVARCSAALHIESLGLSILEPDQKVRILKKECDHSNQEMDTFPRKEYLKVGRSETRHFNAIFSHYIFDHREEESELLKGLVASKKNKQLTHIFKESKKELVPFNLRGFLKGDSNVVFYELNQKPPGTSKADYFKMRSLLIMRKQDCVNLLLDQFIKRFFEQAWHQGSIDDHVKEELKLMEELRKAHQYTPEQFITLFMQLGAIDPNWLPENATEFHQLVCQFLDGHDFSPVLNPPLLRSALKQVRTGKLSPVPLCCWTLIKYKKWLTCLLERKIDPKHLQGISCEQLFEQNYQQAFDIIQGLKAEFKENNPPGVISGEKYKEVIWAEIDKYRLKYNQLHCMDYFLFLPDLKMAKSYFINNCLLDIDREDQVCELRTTIVINEMTEFFRNELCKIDESWMKPLRGIKEFKKECVDLFNSMILDPSLMDQLWWVFKMTLQALSAHKPLVFIVEDLKESFRIIFNKALKGLYKILDQQPGKLIAIYAIQQIKYLELRAIEAHGNDLNLNAYFDKVKNVFKVHLDFVENMEKHPCLGKDSPSNEIPIRENPIDESPLHESPRPKIKTKDKRTKKIKVLAFNYKEVKDDKLALVLKALIKLDAVSKYLNVPQLRAIYNGEEVTCPVEWQGSVGDLATFIKESIRINGPGFTSCKQPWKITVKCFVQKGGMAFDPQQLRLAKPTLLERKFKEAARKFK